MCLWQCFVQDSGSDEEGSEDEEEAKTVKKVNNPTFSRYTTSGSVYVQEPSSDEESSENEKQEEVKIVNNKVNNSTFSLTQSLIHFMSRSRAQMRRTVGMRRRRRSLSITPEEEKSSGDKDSW